MLRSVPQHAAAAERMVAYGKENFCPQNFSLMKTLPVYLFPAGNI